MYDFSIRFESIVDVWSASLNWLAGGNRHTTDNSVPGLDLGDGRELSATDVVETHFDGLVIPPRPVLSTDVTDDHTDHTTQASAQQDSQPLDPSSLDPTLLGPAMPLNKAIGTLAPHLLPLIQIAEQLAELYPSAPPPKEFRTLLNEALLAERKQQMNKQAIGIQPAETDDPLLGRLAGNKYTLFAGLPIVLIVILYLWYVRRPKHKTI